MAGTAGGFIRPDGSRRRRLVPALLAGLIELGLALTVLYGLAGPAGRARVTDAISAIAFTQPPPPRTPPPPPQQHHHKDAGKAAPPARKAQAAPIYAPKVAVAKPIIPTAPTPGRGAAPSNGAALAGNGSGAGGQGNGTGAGGDGNGEGDGGDDPEWVGGKIKDSDYPEAARAAHIRGTTETEISVSPQGRATGCRVTRSSGSALLDDTTCRLVLQRFRFNPATDAGGRPIAGVVDYDQEWRPAGGGD